MTEYTDRIVTILAECPQGLTAKQVAKRLGVSSRNLGSRLSKLVAYGIIRKTRARVGVVVTGLYFEPTLKSSLADQRGRDASPSAFDGVAGRHLSQPV